jgi:hypothetical protein
VDAEGIRERCAARLAELGSIADASVEELCGIVARQVGHRILLYPVSSGDGLGIVTATSTAYEISYDSTVDRHHQIAIICHELGHILHGHCPSRQRDKEVHRSIADLFYVTGLGEMLGLKRSTYTAPEDREAEVLGRMLLSALLLGRGLVGHEDPKVSEPLRRFRSNVRGERLG